MNLYDIRVTVLWIHVLCASVWVGASAAFVIAALASGGSKEESLAFVRRLAPRISRIDLTAALGLAVTGALNFLFLGRIRHFFFSSQFRSILGAKTFIFGAMFLALITSFRAERELRSKDEQVVDAARGRIVLLFAATVMLGVTALALALWLAGSH